MLCGATSCWKMDSLLYRLIRNVLDKGIIKAVLIDSSINRSFQDTRDRYATKNNYRLKESYSFLQPFGIIFLEIFLNEVGGE